MRIAGNTIRRNYLSRYEKNYGDKYNSEKKLYSGRQFDRASENPISAARALRVRKSQAEVETYQTNLKTADSIYTNAETSLLQLSSILQNVYEKLVEGAHGTRNQDDLNIIAQEIDNYAEEMVQSMNIDIADRKVFGGLNNDTVAFKIESSAMGGEKYVTYNGVAVNSSNNPESFPYSGTSYLDIGIGMTTDGNTDRIDDQTALPITFNGAECTGCGMTSKTAAIDLNSLVGGKLYEMDIYAGGRSKKISFTAEATDSDNVNIINDALKTAFRDAPELDINTMEFKYLDDYRLHSYESVPMNGNKIDMTALNEGTYYSLNVTLNNRSRVVNFLAPEREAGQSDADYMNDLLLSLDTSLKEKFGDDAYSDGGGGIHLGSKYTGVVKNNLDNLSPLPVDASGNLNMNALTPGENYAINISTPKLLSDGSPMTDEDGNVIYNTGEMVYFQAADDGSGGLDLAATVQSINDYIANNELFGESTVPYITETGTFVYDVDGANVIIDNSVGAENKFEFSEINGYPKNLIQLVLDSGKLLRKGDQDMVARYADLIYAAQSNLSIAITDLGTHSKFIEFNQDRLSEIQINLNDKQNDIESTDMPTEITKWKVLESVYNASLQMGASVLSQSIFNYIS